jgi:hypothetical protein
MLLTLSASSHDCHPLLLLIIIFVTVCSSPSQLWGFFQPDSNILYAVLKKLQGLEGCELDLGLRRSVEQGYKLPNKILKFILCHNDIFLPFSSRLVSHHPLNPTPLNTIHLATVS